MPGNFSRKVILVTGCSSGFGLVTAARLAGRGHKVFATVRDLKKSGALEIETRKYGGEKNLKILPLDVTRPDTIKSAVHEIVSEEGIIEVLINNAGFGIGGFFEDLSDQDLREQFDTNFFGVLNVTRAVLPVMRPRKKGLIINISSMSASAGTPAFSAYCSSKWALEGFSECLYMELKPLGIHTVLVEPGSYRTGIFEENARYAENFYNHRSPYFKKSHHLKEVVGREIKKNRRDPQEVAAVIEGIVNSSSPSFRNVVGLRSRLRFFLVRHIPFKFYAWLVQWFLYPKE